MRKVEKVLIGAAVAIGVTDAVLTHRAYLKKKGIAVRDLVLKNLDDLRFCKNLNPEHPAEEIPIEGEGQD